MTKSHFFSLVVVSVAMLAGCSSGDGEITIEASKMPLTDNGGDEAVTVTVEEAPEEGYALDKITVKAKPSDSETTFDLSCTPSDVNTNQKLDRGDTLACKEGSANDLGAALAGKEITIEVHANVDGEDRLVGEATWTAAAAK